MSDYVDDIIDLRDDDSDTLQTSEESEDEQEKLEDLEVDVCYRVEPRQTRHLANTDLELLKIKQSLDRVLESVEKEEMVSSPGRELSSHQGSLPPRIKHLKLQLIEEFETVCNNERLLVFLLCGQTKNYLNHL